MDTEGIVKGIIEAEVIKALNSAPEAIEKLVKSALSKPIGADGKFDSYGTKMPYLDYLVGEEIRAAARGAVLRVITEQVPKIEEMVRAGLSGESVVSALVQAFVGASHNDYRIKVNFEAVK